VQKAMLQSLGKNHPTCVKQASYYPFSQKLAIPTTHTKLGTADY
tara:strand:+ start:43 stop:174 length:132 start_codon:yes stop_codon:yes gene_type:complete